MIFKQINMGLWMLWDCNTIRAFRRLCNGPFNILIAHGIDHAFSKNLLVAWHFKLLHSRGFPFMRHLDAILQKVPW